MTATAEIEVQLTQSTPDTMECNVCNSQTRREHVFPIGTQDPSNSMVAVIFICRSCFVGNISLDLRRAIYALWDI